MGSPYDENWMAGLFDGRCTCCGGTNVTTGGCLTCNSQKTFCAHCGTLLACGCGKTFEHQCPMITTWSTVVPVGSTLIKPS